MFVDDMQCVQLGVLFASSWCAMQRYVLAAVVSVVVCLWWSVCGCDCDCDCGFGGCVQPFQSDCYKQTIIGTMPAIWPPGSKLLAAMFFGGQVALDTCSCRTCGTHSANLMPLCCRRDCQATYSQRNAAAAFLCCTPVLSHPATQPIHTTCSQGCLLGVCLCPFVQHACSLCMYAAMWMLLGLHQDRAALLIYLIAFLCATLPLFSFVPKGLSAVLPWLCMPFCSTGQYHGPLCTCSGGRLVLCPSAGVCGPLQSLCTPHGVVAMRCQLVRPGVALSEALALDVPGFP